MAIDSATRTAFADPARVPAPAAAVLISARPGAMSMRITPTLHAQGLATVVLEPATPDRPAELPALLREWPERCIGFADQPAGVSTARALSLGLVVGLGGGTRAQRLIEAGADLTIGTPAELCGGRYYEAFAARHSAVPDPLANPAAFAQAVGAAGSFGVLVDARALLPPHRGAAFAAALRCLHPRVPLAVLGGADLVIHTRALGIERADLLVHDGLGLAPPALAAHGRASVAAAQRYLERLAGQLGLPPPEGDLLGLRLRVGVDVPLDTSLLRRAVTRTLSGLGGIEWEWDGRGAELRAALHYPVPERLAALRTRWQTRCGVSRVLLLSGSARYEAWLRALQPDDTGVTVAPEPCASAATWRLADPNRLSELLALVSP